MGAGASVSPRSRSGRILLTSNGLSTPEITLYFMKQVLANKGIKMPEVEGTPTWEQVEAIKKTYAEAIATVKVVVTNDTQWFFDGPENEEFTQQKPEIDVDGGLLLRDIALLQLLQIVLLLPHGLDLVLEALVLRVDAVPELLGRLVDQFLLRRLARVEAGLLHALALDDEVLLALEIALAPRLLVLLLELLRELELLQLLVRELHLAHLELGLEQLLLGDALVLLHVALRLVLDELAVALLRAEPREVVLAVLVMTARSLICSSRS